MRDRLTVVHLIPLLGAGGGAERVVHDVCLGLDRTRFRPVLLYWKEPDDLVPSLRASGVEAERLLLGPVVSLRSVALLARALTAVRADILHTHFIDADMLGFLSAPLTRVPQVVSVHSFPFPENRRQGLRYRLMAPALARVVCVSGSVRDHVRALTGIGEEKFRVVHNGLDVEEIARRAAAADRAALRAGFGFSDDAVVLGNVSRLIPDKGHSVLLDALADLCPRYPRLRALIIGSGPLLDDLSARVRGLGLEGRVVFAGRRMDVPQLLAAMDLFVFPTYREAFGLCVLEAMAAGLPVVASDDAAVPEVLENGRHGVLLRPGDPGALARAVASLLDDPRRASALGGRAARRARDFSVHRMVEGHARVYEEIAAP